jgi:hypothetical protein
MSYHSAATFRTLGNAAASQNLFTIYNGDASKVVRVRSLVFQEDATAVLTAYSSVVKVSRGTSISGGTTLTKVDWDTSAASDADVVCRGATASDGGGATAITATPGTTLWQQFIMRIHTLVGQIFMQDSLVLPLVVESTPVILRPSEGLVVNIVNGTAASNLATNHYIVNCMWTEDAS